MTQRTQRVFNYSNRISGHFINSSASESSYKINRNSSTSSFNLKRNYTLILPDCCQTMFTVDQGCNSSSADNIREKPAYKHSLTPLGSKLGYAESYTGNLQKRSRHIPQQYKLLTFNRNKTMGINNGIVLHQHAPFPDRSCREIVYLDEPKKKCLVEYAQRSGRSIKLMFIGDSYARILMSYFLYSLSSAMSVKPNQKREIIALRKRKSLKPWSMSLPYMRVTLYPFPHLYVDNDVPKDPIAHLCSSLTHTYARSRLPDVLVVSAGLWSATFTYDFGEILREFAKNSTMSTAVVGRAPCRLVDSSTS